MKGIKEDLPALLPAEAPKEKPPKNPDDRNGNKKKSKRNKYLHDFYIKPSYNVSNVSTHMANPITPNELGRPEHFETMAAD